MESLNQSFGIQMQELASTSSSPTALAHENGNISLSILQPPSEESQEIQLLKHEVAVWKSSHNENLKAMAILESKNYELHHLLQNDIQKLRNEVAQFENETLNHQKLKEIQMFETSQKQELKSGDEDAEHMKQIIADLMATVDKQREIISDMEKKHAADRECFEDVTKILESDIAALELKKDEEKKSFEAKIAEMEQRIADLHAINKNLLDTGNKVGNTSFVETFKSEGNTNVTERIENDQHLVIKKLVKLKQGTSWHGYSTLNGYEKPIKIRCDENGNLFLNNIKSSKKLILEGAITYFNSDPFKGKAECVENNALVFGDLHYNAHAWNITDLFLHSKFLGWSIFQDIVASGSIKKLYFTDIMMRDIDGAIIQLEDIMEKLPNIEKFRYDVVGTKFFSVSKETSKNLVELPCFNYLQIFQLYNIVFEEFDADGFLDFMKKHPAAKFTLSFRPTSWLRKGYVMGLKNRMLKSCPTPKNLTFK